MNGKRLLWRNCLDLFGLIGIELPLFELHSFLLSSNRLRQKWKVNSSFFLAFFLSCLLSCLLIRSSSTMEWRLWKWKWSEDERKWLRWRFSFIWHFSIPFYLLDQNFKRSLNQANFSSRDWNLWNMDSQ